MLATRRRSSRGRPPGTGARRRLSSRAHRRLPGPRPADGDGDDRPAPRGPEASADHERSGLGWARERPPDRQPRPDPGRLLDPGRRGRDLRDRGPLGRRAADRRRLRGGASRGRRIRSSRCPSRASRRPTTAGRPTHSSSGSRRCPDWAAEEADCRIAIGADTNTRQLSGVPPERQTRRQAATRGLMQKTMERAARGEHRWVYTLYPTNAYASDAEMSLERVRGLLLPRLPRRRRRSARRLEAGLGGVPPPRGMGPGARGDPDRRIGDRPAPRNRGPAVHRRRRRAQHARRRVLHRPDRGLGRGRGELPPAGGDRWTRGRRGEASLRGRQGRRRDAPIAGRSS